MRNAYKLSDSDGIKASLTAVYDILYPNDPVYHENYSNKVMFASQIREAAQQEFIFSTKTDMRTVFLFDSTSWENESKDFFEFMENTYGEEYGYGKRNFGWFPLPRFVGTNGVSNQHNTKTTMLRDVDSGGWMLNANVDKTTKTVALGFIEFCNSEQMMARFTEVTGIMRPYEYKMSDAQISAMTPYTRNVYEYVQKARFQNDSIEFVSCKTQNPLILNAQSYFGKNYEFKALLYKGTEEEKTVLSPFRAFFEDENLTVEEYILGIKENYNATTWESNLSQFYPDFDAWLNG